jgi:hypothetical protein
MEPKIKQFVVLGALGLAATCLLIGILIGNVLNRPSSKTFQKKNNLPAKSIVLAGDIACDSGQTKSAYTCHDGDTAKLIASIKPQAVLTVGDNQYPNGALLSFQTAYDKTWGQFKNITHPVPGNHEYNTPGATGYFDYFGEQAGQRGQGYYTFTVGEWRFFALNSEIDTSDTSPQLNWLKQTLAANKNKCSLVYWHRPRFSGGGHASDPTYGALWRLLYANNVDVVVNGHSHAYERFAPQNPDGQPDPERGITELVSGMGGYAPEDLNNPLPNLVNRQNHAFGVLKLTLYPTYARYQFVSIPGVQTFVDSGSITCH